MTKNLLSLFFALMLVSSISFGGNGTGPTESKIETKEIKATISSKRWVINAQSSRCNPMVSFQPNGTYMCYYDYHGVHPDSVSGHWNINQDTITLFFSEHIEHTAYTTLIKSEVVKINNDELIMKSGGMLYSYSSEQPSKKSEIEHFISSTRWVLDKNKGTEAMIEFEKGGAYKCSIDYNLESVNSVSGRWSVENDEVIILADKINNFQPKSLRMKVLNINSYDLFVQYNGMQASYHSSSLIIPTPYSDNTESKPKTTNVQSAISKDELYSKFVGTYHLKKSDGIEYDRMAFRFKKGNSKQLECVRTFKLRNGRTGKLGPENVVVYEVIKLDKNNKKITMKSGDNTATYDFTDNECGGYDIIIFDQVLVYSCNKQ